MPKVVAHPQRREFFVGVTWRLIVAEGLSAVTLRRVAAEAGFSNGALKPYFASKSALMEAAYRMAFDRTVERSRRSLAGHGGIEAIRRLCYEIMPLDEERRIEARVVVAFWEEAVGDPALCEIFASTMADFSDQLGAFLDEGRACGEVLTEASNEAVVNELMWMMMGLQSMRWLVPQGTSPDDQLAVLERVLGSLTVPSPAFVVQR